MCRTTCIDVYFSPPSSTRANAFYFTPLKKTKYGKWYLNRPSDNSIQTTVKRICAMAGITGKNTNHSLRSTAADRLYEANISEQQMCEQTGHRSDAVRVYKRTSDEQKAMASDVLACKVPKSEENSNKNVNVASTVSVPPSEPESSITESRGNVTMTFNFH
ncbi:uncharacterized protein LOC124113159 [Haliotis rufescens]|uniref:uncharacterized protein LOC124113159 n=1 Tax=Haliotis rufescens TaxID=6454 RepID=UPI00201ECB42|nr:uncharacterized protein LOC124113159 [Haliotis rufescens]